MLDHCGWKTEAFIINTLWYLFFYSIWLVFIGTGSACFVYMVMAVDASPVLALQDTAYGWSVRENCCGNECCQFGRKPESHVSGLVVIVVVRWLNN